MKNSKSRKITQSNKGSNAQRNYNRRSSNMKTSTKDSKSAKYDTDLATNDPAWYATNQQLLTDVASFPFAYPVGSPIRLNNLLFRSLSNRGGFVSPGLMLYSVIPSVGFSNDAVSPLNVAAASVYSYVRHANSGARNYDDSDLMLYLLAMDQVYSYLNWLQRIYGLSDLFAQRNAYLNRAVLQSEGIDVDDVRRNYANFRAGINILIDKVSQFAVPSTLPLFQRHAMMYSSIYTEGDSIKDQMYMYTPYGFWKFTLDEDGAGSLILTERPSDNAGVAELLEYGSDMIDRVLKDEDFGLFSGDILKAYGDGNLIKLRTMPEVWPVVPTPNLDVLEQMKNATVVPPSVIVEASCTVTQSENKDYLIHTPTLWASQPDAHNFAEFVKDYCRIQALSENRLLSTIRTAPTPTDVMEISRLVASIEVIRDDGSLAEKSKKIQAYVHSGSEIIRSANMIVLGVDGQTLTSYLVEYADPVIVNDHDGTESFRDDLVRYIRANNVSSSFKFHPYECAIYLNVEDAANTFNVTDGMPNYDIDNYTILTAQNIESLHEVAVLSLLGVKAISKL